jgi:hypothetical protein
MRNWLRQRLINLLVNSDVDENMTVATKVRQSRRGGIAIRMEEDICGNDSGIDLPDPISFRVQQISGGTLVESRWYDYKKDEQRVKLHIVTPDENLSESIGKIVTMELLQR